MQKILLDTCGWVAIVDSGLHLDLELSKLVGNFELMVIESVKDELIDIAANRKGKLLIELLEAKSTMIPNPFDAGNHTDNQLITLAKQNSWPVITVDTELKQNLVKSGCNVIEIVQERRLRMI